MLAKISSRELTEWGIYFRIKSTEQALESGRGGSSQPYAEVMGGGERFTGAM